VGVGKARERWGWSRLGIVGSETIVAGATPQRVCIPKSVELVVTFLPGQEIS
jgi:hypothetical protein